MRLMKAGAIGVTLLAALNFWLNIYANDWGLPSRWHSDEKVAAVLDMADKKTLVDPNDSFYHPTGYQLTLLMSFIPVYGYLKLINYPLAELKAAARVSWDHMAGVFPAFARGIYIYARGLSALFGALTVFFLFLLGRELYDKRTGFISSAFLSVCMGFIAVNHFAKYISLVNMLIVLTLFLCVKALNLRGVKDGRRFLNLAFFTAGFACSVQFNAFLLPLALFLTAAYLINIKRSPKEFILFLIRGGLLFILGIILGTPAIITNFKDYALRFFSTYVADKPPQEDISLLASPLNAIVEMAQACGMPLFILALLGIAHAVFRWKKISPKEIVIFSFIAVYYFVVAVLGEDKYPQTKHVIAIVPLLLIFSARFTAGFFSSRRFPKSAAYTVSLAIFAYSLAYSFTADLVFREGDTRHASTNWINENIPKGKKIEVFFQLSYVASTRIMNDYEIIYLGRSSKNFNGRHFFRWDEVEDKESYMEYLNKHDSGSDYIIVNIKDVDSIMSTALEHYIPGLNRYLKALFMNEKHFRIAAVFKAKNQKIKSRRLRGLLYFQNFWWDPVPDYSVTANTIYIFKRNRAE